MPRLFLLICWVLVTGLVRAQTPDSVASSSALPEVEVQGYLSRQPLLLTPASAALVHTEQIRQQATETLLPALNAVPGVRMEERSPGSYRLSIRGSVLRSPFGIRNVKIYLDEFPLTDASGNTYLNLLDPRSLRRIEVLKGPDGSLFGANSGGVLLLQTGPETASPVLNAEITGGSFGLLHQSLNLARQTEKGTAHLSQGFQRSDGYRRNSALRRHFVHGSYRYKYSPRSSLKLQAFFADLAYQTPGGLTQLQMEQNPRQARPAAGPNPAAETQQAGIFNHTLFAGAVHETQLTDRLRQVTALFGSGTDYRNPFITNYETRTERNGGIRSYLQFQSERKANFSWNWTGGLEGQMAFHRIRNYGNVQGTKGALQAADGLQALSQVYFSRVSALAFGKLTAEAALSLNFFRYHFRNLPESAEQFSGKRSFRPEWMPRVGVSYLVTEGLAWRAAVSRGYSPPTLAEIRPSGLQINQQLQAETGWSYETGLRYAHPGNRFQADVSVFRFRLNQAIVRRLTDSGDEYFTNAGGTSQTGCEALLSGWLAKAKPAGVINGLQVTGNYTYSHFRFVNYQAAAVDFSGNQLTGVPTHAFGSGLVLHFLQRLSLSGQYQYTGALPLNDANSVFSAPVHLLQARLGFASGKSSKTGWETYLGADNLLNKTYTLGHDLNAFGNRYFNPAPHRNYYAGLRVHF